MTEDRRKSAFVNHPWTIRIVGGAISGVLVAFILTRLFGWDTQSDPPTRPSSAAIKVAVNPDLLSVSGNGAITITATGLTANGPVGITVDGNGAGVRGEMDADGKGQLTYNSTIFSSDSPPDQGVRYQVVILDESTGATGTTYVITVH